MDFQDANLVNSPVSGLDSMTGSLFASSHVSGQDPSSHVSGQDPSSHVSGQDSNGFMTGSLFPSSHVSGQDPSYHVSGQDSNGFMTSSLFPSCHVSGQDSNDSHSIKSGPKQDQEDSLFSDGEEDQEMKAVKETISSEIKEMEQFVGCELLPMDFKRKKKSVPTVKAIKKRNDEYCVRVDLKKKSFASKGYKKVNVQRIKRQAHRKLRRNKCFSCGEQGHWANDCPMRNKSSEGQEEVEASQDNVPFLSADVPLSGDVPFLSADDVVQDNESDNEVRESDVYDMQLFDLKELESENLFF